MILLADANVLMDLCYADGLHVLSQIAPTEVLDVVLDECIHPKQPDIEKQVYEAGIKVIQTDEEWFYEALRIKTESLSDEDSLNLYYAKQFSRVLLTNDGALRNRCAELRVPFHGTLWLMEEAYRRSLVDVSELCRWIQVFRENDRRSLPLKETNLLMHKLGCSEFIAEEALLTRKAR